MDLREKKWKREERESSGRSNLRKNFGDLANERL